MSLSKDALTPAGLPDLLTRFLYWHFRFGVLAYNPKRTDSKERAGRIRAMLLRAWQRRSVFGAGLVAGWAPDDGFLWLKRREAIESFGLKMTKADLNVFY